jgi:type VI protein secretion system component VasK
LQPLVFNHDFPGTSDSVINMYEVPRWYTKTAYENFQKRLKDDRNLGGEDWVLGQHDKSNTDYTAMRGHLAERYDSDYIKTWRAFMAATSEKVPYGLGNYIGASGVLARMSGPKSTLMQLFCLASENTSVNSKAVLQAFQPVQLVAPPGCIRQLVSAAANPYVLELGKLSEALKAIGPNPSDALAAPAKAEQANAIASEGALTAGFQSDTTDRTDAVLKKSVSLLYDPIEDVTGALSGLGAGPVNQAAGKACSEINNLFRKYPFSYGSHEEASLDNINEVLNPQTGKLWALVHSEVMKPLLQQNGVRYDRTIGQTTNITQRFLDFINKASVMTQAMYRDASGTPNMSFTLQALPSPDIDFVTLTIDGTALTGEPKNSPQKTFPWPGPSQGVSLSARMAGSSGDFGIIPTATGLWSAWRALDKAVRVGDTVQWTPLQPSGDPLQVHNHPATVRFGLDPQSAQILRPQFFAGMSCPVPAAQ